jgi:hypothetical protein
VQDLHITTLMTLFHCLQPEMMPGSCWAFQGSKGHLVIELSANITPSAFTLEHISKSLTAEGKIDSAPKDFTVRVSSSDIESFTKKLLSLFSVTCLL